ncbi:MAG: DUF4296 domain-containing protein [Tamlana sp.]|jgi:hypothetical protein
MILKHFIYFLSIVLLITACNRIKGPDKPKNLISKEKMVDILIDTRLIASASSVNKRIMMDNGVDIKAYVFKKYNIDSLQFALSNEYYAFRVKDYKEIYDKVEDSLEELKTKFKELEANEWKEKTKREEDSIKALSKKKDTIRDLKIVDSLKLKLLDSLDKNRLREKIIENGTLIAPVLDTVAQPN